MTYKELLNKLTTYEGPCFRLCSYCPEDFNTAEVKECVEDLVKNVYKLRAMNDTLREKLAEIQEAYHKETGKDYAYENHQSALRDFRP